MSSIRYFLAIWLLLKPSLCLPQFLKDDQGYGLYERFGHTLSEQELTDIKSDTFLPKQRRRLGMDARYKNLDLGRIINSVYGSNSYDDNSDAKKTDSRQKLKDYIYGEEPININPKILSSKQKQLEVEEKLKNPNTDYIVLPWYGSSIGLGHDFTPIQKKRYYPLKIRQYLLKIYHTWMPHKRKEKKSPFDYPIDRTVGEENVVTEPKNKQKKREKRGEEESTQTRDTRGNNIYLRAGKRSVHPSELGLSDKSRIQCYYIDRLGGFATCSWLKQNSKNGIKEGMPKQEHVTWKWEWLPYVRPF